ncbi:MAG: glycoside hydrolase family 15 protein, partial [Candidatus Eremiobacteraeota bacterium]|nr:glycoside hydrolase family 15 protein [Candidatus Eremiobacteraeota bacterium]
PTGSFVAAVTTSLPECVGGSKNWDYRFCWLRDASFSVRALLQLGYADEARRWRDWFATVYVDAPEHLHIMYAVDGERLPQERTLPWLGGFADSRPVRVANDAHEQFQLGVFGDVLTAFERMQHAGIVFDAANWLTVESLMRHVERVWQTPGSGIWETRDGGRQYVDSKVLAWVALERGLAIAARGGFAADTARWRGLQERMHAQVCSAGYDPGRNTFTQYYGSQELDASLLLMPLVGFLPADDPRVAGTIAAIERHLMEGDSVYRYSADRVHAPEGGQPDEGSFTMCGFWLVEAYALLGRIADARALFERLVTLANDVGLFSEELDVARGIAIGNVPQAFSHVGAILAAHRLTECEAW